MDDASVVGRSGNERLGGLRVRGPVRLLSSRRGADVHRVAMGTADLLPGEDGAAYKALWMDIAKDIAPSNVIEWLWIQ
jgi:hypothetical protein